MKHRIKDYFFNLGLFIFIVTEVTNLTLFELNYSLVWVLRFIALGLLGIKMLMTEYSRTALVLTVLGIGVMGISFLCSGGTILPYYSLILASMYKENTKCVLKMYLYVQFTIVIVTVVASQLGFLFDYIKDGMYLGEYRVRHFLGFTFTSTPPVIFMFCIMEYVYLSKAGRKYFPLLFQILFTVYLYYKTDTTFSFCISIVTLIFTCMIAYNHDWQRFVVRHKRMICLIPGIFAVFSIWLQAFYDSENETWAKLNKFVHTRLGLGHDAIQKYGYTPFGSRVIWKGAGIGDHPELKYNYVDSSYLQIMIQYGIVVLAIILILYSVLLYLQMKNEHYDVVGIIIFILLFSTMEPRLADIIFNPFLLISVTELTGYKSDQTSGCVFVSA